MGLGTEFTSQVVKSALVIGASRGLGRQIALTLASNSYNVGVAAKTVQPSATLPGSIHTVSEEVERCGARALPIKCDVRSIADIDNAIHTTIDTFGSLDYAIYNAGSILWKPLIDTPMKRFDLMHEVNTRGAYAMVQAVLPYFLERKSGKILLVAPPIYSRFFQGKTPYSVTKVGMTVLVHGLANELEGTGVSISALWPAVATESYVTEKQGIDKSLTRNACLFADACLVLGDERSEKYNGRTLIDEDLLRETGVTDFRQYRSNPDVEPPRMMPRQFPSLRVAEENAELISKL